VSGADKHSKTEAPTPKRLREARQKGQVARSPDIAGWTTVLAATMLVPALFRQVQGRVLTTTDDMAHVMSHPSVPGALGVLGTGMKAFVLCFLPIGFSFMAVAVAVNVLQVGRGMSLQAAAPKFSRISPKEGIKRLFSSNTVFELGKQVLKLGALTGIGYSALFGLGRAVTGTRPTSLIPIISFTATTIIGFTRAIAVIGLALGVGDYVFQRHRMMKGLKMTKQEVKDEHRQQEGDPAVKGELRKRQYAIARSRTIAAVRTADVVVTNPTHFAVALQYTPGSGRAPILVGKGADRLAQRIRQEAAEHRVPVVEDPPLARYLFATCEVDQAIPGEIYLVVARLLAYVYSLPVSGRAVGVHRRPASVVPSEPEAISALRPGRQAAARRLLGAGVDQ